MGVHDLGYRNPHALRERLTAHGLRVYDLDGQQIHCEVSFFTECLRKLPMGDASIDEGPDWRFPQNWNAFSDFLWQGLTSAPDARVAIVWVGIDVASSKDPSLVHEALSSFAGLVRGLRHANGHPDVHPVRLHLLL